MGAELSQRCPAILVAAPASGQGKTTVACALARLHARQGRRVRAFKCGPDFLDPFWLAQASGAPVHQLDLWMTGEDDCRARLHAAARDADLLIVEGVMGLFDGEPSAADLARRFDLPVLAVVDAAAMAGTFGALAFGLQHYQGGLRWAGVLANRVASARHAQLLQGGLREPADWLGGLPRDSRLTLPERHLGLTVATELDDALARLDAAADALAATPLGRLEPAALQRWAVDFTAPTAAAAGRPLAGRTIAVARDAAFCFIYAANLECLRALGAELRFFSPLAGAALPACDALWLPGGYPELHAARLSANRALQANLVAHVQAGKPVWAECGGMMALFDTLVDTQGQAHALWGLLPGRVQMQPRLAALGPQQLTLPAGTLRGHTFHYSTCATPLAPLARTARPGQAPAPDAGEALLQHGSIRASYFHAWFASSPAATAALFTRPNRWPN
ncbi:cobyrinate a,c-diamide synthase [Pseudorhodoferax soli]|uniref:Hydrogenobyrinic acid a,c-diamide synthase (Glutamine-hydrolysing) /cobyrinate a,c-diamide synthase n=1 Tax=Pseudorhodoferax soli TaxID=545864 RepID=A0A368XK79_9BURK|nr:cobyrinate a,c-diamide synthase [Pseudorhodoferax soli]RCW68255.1 hydrogenobyrinic acid a,c-diamide synthase (glutamine-hydrolysing) /cobyrinate a,c-diamide synthase [Pseudorhodoferax soli]